MYFDPSPYSPSLARLCRNRKREREDLVDEGIHPVYNTRCFQKINAFVLILRGNSFDNLWPVLSQDVLAHKHADMTCRDRQLHDLFRPHVALYIEDLLSRCDVIFVASDQNKRTSDQTEIYTFSKDSSVRR